MLRKGRSKTETDRMTETQKQTHSQKQILKHISSTDRQDIETKSQNTHIKQKDRHGKIQTKTDTARSKLSVKTARMIEMGSWMGGHREQLTRCVRTRLHERSSIVASFRVL